MSNMGYAEMWLKWYETAEGKEYINSIPIKFSEDRSYEVDINSDKYIVNEKE